MGESIEGFLRLNFDRRPPHIRQRFKPFYDSAGLRAVGASPRGVGLAAEAAVVSRCGRDNRTKDRKVPVPSAKPASCESAQLAAAEPGGLRFPMTSAEYPFNLWRYMALALVPSERPAGSFQG